MNKLLKLVLALGSTLLCFNAAYASNNSPTTFLGPTLKGGYTSTLNNYTAYSVLGEAGLKNFRLGGTLGWKLEQNQYVKVSAEYLWQDITYNFFSGNTDQWVQQGAIGAGYLYEFTDVCYDPHFDLNAYLSHAPSKSLSAVKGVGVIGGVKSNFTDQRHIAGSNGAGITPAVSIAPWVGSRAGLGLNYDNVRYNKKYSPNEDAKGLGGTFTFNQVVVQDVNLGLEAAVRQPFNNYAAELSFANVPYFGKWVLGVDGEYTAGKNTLPNTWNIGLSANYYMDQRCCCESAPVYKDSVRFKDQPVAVRDDLVAYTSDPAVYMPQVLAIPEEQVTGCPFGQPTFTGTITGQTSAPDTIQTYNSPTQFGGSNLTYSVAYTQTSGIGTKTTVTLNSKTGVVTATGVRSTTNITITATNPCGKTVSSNTFVATFI